MLLDFFSSFHNPYGGCAFPLLCSSVTVLPYSSLWACQPYGAGLFVRANLTGRVFSFCQPYGAGLFVRANLTGLGFLFVPALRGGSFCFASLTGRVFLFCQPYGVGLL